MRFYRSVTLLFIVLIIFVAFHHDNEKSNDHKVINAVMYNTTFDVSPVLQVSQ